MGWPQNAYVGQKVVRYKEVSVEMRAIRPEAPVPPLGEVLTVSYVGVAGSFVLLEFEGYSAPESQHFERGFEASYFRPVQGTQKGFEELQKLLNPRNHKDIEDVHPNSPVPEKV